MEWPTGTDTMRTVDEVRNMVYKAPEKSRRGIIEEVEGNGKKFHRREAYS